MWTEYAPQETVDSKLFPRIMALAEVAWSPKRVKDWNAFKKRVGLHYPYLRRLGVDYGRERESSFYMIKYFLRDVSAFFRILRDDPSTAWVQLLMYVGIKK